MFMLLDGKKDIPFMELLQTLFSSYITVASPASPCTQIT
jgi:hypothetical protein